MAPATVETFTDANPRDALVVVAFHGTGAAAAIAASYLRQSLNLPLVGHVRVADIGAVVNVQAGIATSPIRIFGGEVECRLDKGCPSLYIVLAEMPVDANLVDDIAEAVLSWAGAARAIVCLDSVNRDDGEEEPDVYAIADDAETLALLEPTGAAVMQGGFLVGMTAAVLSRSRDHGAHGAALVVEAAAEHPDARAAAALVSRVDPLLPEIRVDAAPLLDEAKIIEQKLAALQKAQTAQAVRSPHTFI